MALRNGLAALLLAGSVLWNAWGAPVLGIGGGAAGTNPAHPAPAGLPPTPGGANQAIVGDGTGPGASCEGAPPPEGMIHRPGSSSRIPGAGAPAAPCDDPLGAQAPDALGSGDGTPTSPVAGWPEARSAWLAALARGEVVAVTLLPRPGAGEAVRRQIQAAGGRILWEGRVTAAIAARVPAPVLPRILPGLEAIQVDGPVATAVPSPPVPGADVDDRSLPFERALHQANLEAIGATGLRGRGWTGRGVRVAVIDTGADPGLPALRRRIVDYVDFTTAVPFAERAERARAEGPGVLVEGQNPAWAAEGDVFLTGAVRAGRAGSQGVRVRWEGLELHLPPWAAGRAIRLGWLDEANVGAGGTDLNGNGTVRDRWLVVAYPEGASPDERAPSPGDRSAASDAAAPPGGPRVQIDADQDLDLAEEPALQPVAQGGGVAWLGPVGPGGEPTGTGTGAPALPPAQGPAAEQARGAAGGGSGPAAGAPPAMAVAVTAVDPQGALVNFGFDAHGHGTRMASILAAAGSTYQGVAPGVEMVVLKALGSRGQGDWSQILAAVDYAVAHGVDVISLSAESRSPEDELPVTERVLREAVARGVLPVLAAGNGGPGLHTALALPADAGLVVGAFLPAQAAALLGDPAGERLLPYSAAGPARDGTPSPSLVAPGVTYALVPSWQSGQWPGGLAPDEGTSVAVPYVAGLAALLLEQARQQAPALPAAALGPVLQATARPLAGVPAAVQGFGVPRAAAAVEALEASGPAVRPGPGAAGSSGWSVLWLHRGRPYRGVFWDGPPPGVLTFHVRHGGAGAVVAGWAGVPPWARFPGSMPYPAGEGIALPVQYQLPEQPGLYSALVRLEGGGPLAAGFLQTFVRPHDLAGGNLQVQGTVPRGQVRRVFVDVPPGVTRLVFRIDRPAAGGTVEGGSLAAWVYGPGGRLVRDSARDAGQLIGGPELPDWTVEIPSPEAGVWEVDLFFSPLSPAAFDRTASPFRMTATAQGVAWQPRELEVTAPGPQGARLWEGVTLVPFGRAVRGRVAGMGWDVGLAVEPGTRGGADTAEGTPGGAPGMAGAAAPPGQAGPGAAVAPGGPGAGEGAEGAGNAGSTGAGRAGGSGGNGGRNDGAGPAAPAAHGEPAGAADGRARAGQGEPTGTANGRARAVAPATGSEGTAPGDRGTAPPDPMAEERAQVVVVAGEPQPYRFDVAAGTALLQVQAGPAPRAGWRVHLYLYRVEEGAAQPVGDGRGDPVAVVADPVPGRYYAVVELEPAGAEPPAWREGPEPDGGALAVPLVVRRFHSGGGIRVAAGSVDLAAGQPARIMAVFDVPPGTGEQRGYLVLLDDAGAIGAPLPVRVRRGPPRLVVTAVVPPVAPGQPARVTLQVRDRSDGMLRDASLIVDGRLYTTAGGRVTLPWDGRHRALDVRVLGAGEESRQRVVLPGRPAG